MYLKTWLVFSYCYILEFFNTLIKKIHLSIWRYPVLCQILYGVMFKKWDIVYVEGLIDKISNKHWFLIYIYLYGENIHDNLNLPSFLNVNYLKNVKCCKLSCNVKIRDKETTIILEDSTIVVTGNEVLMDCIDFI